MEKSHVGIVAAWLRRNCRQVARRCGAGGIQNCLRIRCTVDAPTRQPRPSNSPWIPAQQRVQRRQPNRPLWPSAQGSAFVALLPRGAAPVTHILRHGRARQQRGRPAQQPDKHQMEHPYRHKPAISDVPSEIVKMLEVMGRVIGTPTTPPIAPVRMGGTVALSGAAPGFPAARGHSPLRMLAMPSCPTVSWVHDDESGSCRSAPDGGPARS